MSSDVGFRGAVVLPVVLRHASHMQKNTLPIDEPRDELANERMSQRAKPDREEKLSRRITRNVHDVDVVDASSQRRVE